MNLREIDRATNKKNYFVSNATLFKNNFQNNTWILSLVDIRVRQRNAKGSQGHSNSSHDKIAIRVFPATESLNKVRVFIFIRHTDFFSPDRDKMYKLWAADKVDSVPEATHQSCPVCQQVSDVAPKGITHSYRMGGWRETETDEERMTGRRAKLPPTADPYLTTSLKA